MKIEDIDVNKVALFVEQEMERHLSWAANVLTVEDRPPRAIDLRDADVIEADMGKSEAARAVHIIHAFVAGSYSVPMAVELAFRFVWRWIYAPPFISTTGADGLGWDDMAIIPIGDDERAKELAFLLRSVRSYFAPKKGQEREKADASEDTLDDDIDLVTAGQRRLSIPQRRAWGRVAKAALSARKEIVLLRAEVADLERTRMDLARKVLDQANELAELERKIGWLADDIRQKDAALTEANANLRMVEMEPGLAWRWQGDGHDDPASLSCPVIMTAETLRGFVADRARVADLEAQLADAPRRLLAFEADALIDAGICPTADGLMIGDVPWEERAAAEREDSEQPDSGIERRQFGEPTPEERAAADAMALLPREYPGKTSEALLRARTGIELALADLSQGDTSGRG